jgi:acyl-CoA dehydrogenase
MMEQALPQVIAAEPLERKLLKAQKTGDLAGITWAEQLQEAVAKSYLTADEAAIMTRVRDLVMEIIAVDEFEAEDLRLGRQVEVKAGAQHAA